MLQHPGRTRGFTGAALLGGVAIAAPSPAASVVTVTAPVAVDKKILREEVIVTEGS